MRQAAADLNFEEAARLRDEIKQLQKIELAIADDPFTHHSEQSTHNPMMQTNRFSKPDLDHMGPTIDTGILEKSKTKKGLKKMLFTKQHKTQENVSLINNLKLLSC